MEDNNVSNQGNKELIEKLQAKIAALEQENQALRENNNPQNTCNTNDQTQEKPNSSKDGSSTKILFPTYKKRSGTIDAGKEFEYMMCALYALKLCIIKEIVDFRMTTNNEDYGDFDDISLEIDAGDTTRKYLLQLKHKENEEQIDEELVLPEGKHNLTKYLASFEKLKDGDVTCIVYTNKKSKLDSGAKFRLLFEDRKRKYGQKCLGKILMNVTVKKPQALEFLDLLQNKKNPIADNIFQFDITQYNRTFSKLQSFCKNFFYMTHQDNLETVKATVNEMLTSLLKVDIYDSFIFFMKEWWSGTFVLTKRDVISKLVELAMSPWIQTVSATNANSKTKLLSTGIMNFDMTVVKNTNNKIINNIWEDTTRKPELEIVAHKYYIHENQNQRSKILWFLDKVPLIVKVDSQNEKQVEHSIKLLKCFSKKKKLILVGNVGRNEFPKWKVLENLKNLCIVKDIYEEVIRQFRISLQGRKSISLEEFIRKSEDFVDVIEIDDMLKMAQQESLQVGNIVNNLPECYIPRKVSVDCVNTTDLLDSFEHVKKTVLIINCPADFKNTLNTRHASIIDLDEFLQKENLDGLKNLILLSFDYPCTYNKFEFVCKKLDNFEVYLFHTVDKDCCVRLMDVGHKELLKKCKNVQIEETEVFDYFKSELNVLFAPPGMGKSTLFNVLSKNCPTDLWVVHVKLIDYNAFLTKKPGERQLLKHFLDVDEKIESLYTKISNVSLSNKKILILLDGIDELESQNVNHLLHCSQRLVSQGFHVWISSRENWQEKISQDLKLFTTVNIVELSENEQKSYIEKRLKNKYESSDIKEILDSTFESSDIANSRQLLGIPLQLYILTENFLMNESLLPTLRQENIFVLTRMYRFFFEGKKKFHHKKLNIDENLEHQLGFNFEDHLKHYELPALKVCLEEETFAKLPLDKCKPSKFLEDIKTNGDKFGIIRYFNVENKAVFFHQTYAEYFACVWFTQNLDKVKLLREEWFSEKHENLRRIFDIMLSEQSPLHLAVIYNNKKQFRKYVDNSEKDKAGRNVMYLACCYGVKYPLPETLWDGSLCYKNCHLKRESEAYIEIVHSLLERCQNIFEQDSLFGMNYVDYALSSRCLYIIEACLERKFLNFEKIDELLEKYYKFETLAFYASQMNYVHLMKNVLEKIDYDVIFRNYFEKFNHQPGVPVKCSLLFVAIVGSKDDHHIVSKENVESVREILERKSTQQRESCFIDKELQGGTLLSFACEFSRYEIMRLLLSYGTTYYGNNILHMTVSFGTLSNEVLELSKTIGIDINQKNSGGETPLYLACKAGNGQFVKKLLEFGAEIDVQNEFFKENVFHVTAALKKENVAIMQMLLNKMNSEEKSLVNVLDSGGRCPLILACQKGHVDYFKLLRQNGANTDVSSSSRSTILHYSAQKENEEMINIALSFCMEINHKNNYGETALHWACKTGVFNNVKLLIDRGSAINVRAYDESSCLHYAANCDYENTKTIKFLIDNNLQVNAQNSNGVTPLNIACRHASSDTGLHNIRILLRNDADASIADNAGKTPLHYLSFASFEKVNCEIINLLLSDKRLDINATDGDGDTALHLAIKRGANHKITEVLLKNGADPNICDKNGRIALHYLCNHYYKNSLRNCLECINTLVNHGVNINAQDNDGLTPLHLLLKRDTKETLIYVPQNYREAGVDNIVFDDHKMTLQHHKVDEEFLDTFFVDPNNVVRETPPYVTGGRKNWDKFMILLASGVDTNVMDNQGMTAIHYEAMSYFDDAKVITLLVDYGVNLDALNRGGKTALHLAVENKMYNKVKALIEFGADVNIIDNTKKSALHYAMNHPLVEESFLELFLNYDAATRAHDSNLEKYAIEATCYDYVDKLLRKGFDINTKDVNGATVLHYACMRGRLSNVEILFKTGADKYITDNNQQTILHYAAMSSNPERNIMNYLVETGVDIYAKDSNGRNALDVAFEYKCFKALQLLIGTNKFFDSTKVSWSTLLYYGAFGGCCPGIEYLIQNCDISGLDCNRELSLEFLKSDRELQKEKLLQMTECVSHLIEECGTGSTFGYEPLKFVECVQLRISESPAPEWIFPSPADYVSFISTSSDRTSIIKENVSRLSDCIRKLETIHL